MPEPHGPAATGASDEAGSRVEKEKDSLLAELRKRRESIGKDRYLDQDIPGYEGDLVCRYDPIPWDEAKRIADKLEKSSNPRKELYAQADVLIRACREFRIKISDKLVPLQEAFPELGDNPIKFDDRLAKALGFDLVSGSESRSACLRLFNNDMAVSAQHNVVMEWIQSSSRGSDQDF